MRGIKGDSGFTPHFYKSAGFTLAELIFVLFILGFLIGMVALAGARIERNAAYTTTLNEMNEIKKAIKRFYADLEVFPEDGSNPQYATRFLCLRDDNGKQKDEMLDFLRSHGKEAFISWDKYNERGWRGPYMEADRRYYDSADDAYYPLITDAWGGYYKIKGGQNMEDIRILSAGRNRKDDNGEGDDIVVWVFGTEPTYVGNK
jgi:type II secretory pathway pseudopilin PulG